jgi:hypothetical protein
MAVGTFLPPEDTKVYSTGSAFAALKANGSIKAWGKPNSGGKKAPSGRGYTDIYSTTDAKAFLLE